MRNLILAAVVILLASCTSGPEPATEPSTMPSVVGQPRLAARTFNSKLELEVWVQREPDGMSEQAGVTPATEPVEIPSCIDWWVTRIGATTVEAVAQEVRAQSIPGLDLQIATDADLVKLKDMQGLRRLDLRYAEVTDAGLEYLAGLKGLRELYLGNTKVTDAGLEHLKGLRGLRYLGLEGTAVTDDGLEHLINLKGLQTLDVDDTEVTQTGMAMLKKAWLVGRDFPATQPTRTLDQLMASYRDDGLPLPPADAPLVNMDGVLGFLLKGTLQKPELLLIGTEEYTPEDPDQKVDASQHTATVVSGEGGSWNVFNEFPGSTTLATAIQCKARGWDELAEALFQQSITVATDHARESRLHRPKPGTVLAQMAYGTMLAQMAWAHWDNELVRAGTDRAMIARRLRALIAAEPTLNTEGTRALVDSIEAALKPSTAKPGSVEAMIDSLVELTHAVTVCKDGVCTVEKDDKLPRLIALGFDAAPALIEHLDDHRLTREVCEGFNNFSTYHKTVGDVVSDLLQGLAGQDLGKDWLRRQQGYEVEKADARAWWESARKVGEEKYLVSHVLPADPKAGDPEEQILQVIAGKYPGRLPEMYRQLLGQRPELRSDSVAEAVANSSLPAAQKIELLSAGARHANFAHRLAALRQLENLDRGTFDSLLVQSLDAMARTPDGAYWLSPEADFSQLVIDADDPHAWEALLRAARHSDVGLRMELMKPMDYTRNCRAEQIRQRLAFLSALLDDREVRDLTSNPAKYDGPSAFDDFKKAAVGDMAVMQIANILGLGIEPRPDWTAEQWSALRTRCRNELAHAASKLPSM